MKKLVREFEFSPEQLHTVRNLARAVGLSETTAGILYARGMDTEVKMRAFLNPGAKNYLSPMLMKGMKEAVALITQARDEGWRVAVYGDYDADGIGALAVLSRALSRFGIEPYLFVPERTEGYGLSVSNIDRIFDDFLPDLFITVDCGISCRKEVEYIKEQGAFVIVTDHHELPDELPDCIVVNPKIKSDYPYDNLCGAGVAFKLAQALIGDRANDLVDFAAISTVADSVPLLGENRDIVAEGVRRIESSPRPAIAALLGKSNSEVTAQTFSFMIAPRINAAGRMGDVNVALRLFTSEDEEEIAELAARLNEYNAERQRSCDELYSRVRAEIVAEGPYDSVVMLAGDDFQSGFVGLIAARVAEEYARPALLFARRGELLKGSARSIENINIFEALKSCSEYIEEFGGHSQAAGINVRAENFEKLKNALNDYIRTHYDREDFEQTVVVAGKSGSDFRTVAHELASLEPCGIGNRRPMFYTEAQRVDAAPLKPGSPHLSMNIGGMDFVYFNGLKDLAVLRSDLKKQIVFEYNVSRFKGRVYIKGFVRCIIYDGMSGTDIELDGFEHALRLLPTVHDARSADEAELERMIEEKIAACPYGLLAVVQSRATLERFPALKKLEVDVFRLASGSTANAVLFAPEEGASLASFREIVCLDFPAALPACGNAEVLVNSHFADMGAINRVSCVREDLLATFSALRASDGAYVGASYAEAARALRVSDTPEQVVFALAVFEELGLIALHEGRLRFVRGKKTELTNSRIYTAVSRLQEEQSWKRS